LLGKVPPKPETVLMLMVRGRELGFSTAQSLSAFHIIDGVPTLKADAKVALCLQRRDVCEYLRCTESTEDQATWATRRVGGAEERHTYRLEDARAAGLLKPSSSGRPSSWETRPKTMLRWRAATELIAMVYPDLVLGLYTPEEQADIAEVEGRVISVDPDTGEILDDRRYGDETEERHLADVPADTSAPARPWPASPFEPRGDIDGRPADSEDLTHREQVATAVEAMAPEARKAFFATVEPPLSYQAPAVIRDRLSEDLVERMHAALEAAGA
jgi:hypothetical protein